ncbi:MAG: hypothetical protein ACRYFZ_15905 [Janthinobacterium lividum]
MSTSSTKKKIIKDDDYAFRQSIAPEDIDPFIKEESDRGVILILGAYLEELLGGLISDACVTNTLADSIISHKMPIGDFQSRLLLAQAIGLIDETETKALQLIQRIRNKAAHFDRKGEGFNVLFNSHSTISQVTDLARLLELATPIKEQAIIRLCFIAAARQVGTFLSLRRASIKRPSAPKSSKEIAHGMLDEYEGTPIGERLKSIKSSEELAIFYVQAHYLSLIIIKAKDFNVSHEEILRVFDKQIEAYYS